MMLKWIALILVTSVLCWGDNGIHNSPKAKETVTDRVSSEQSQRSHRPVAEGQEKKDDVVEEGIDPVSQAELEKLMKEFDNLTAPQTNRVGEQTEEVN